MSSNFFNPRSRLRLLPAAALESYGVTGRRDRTLLAGIMLIAGLNALAMDAGLHQGTPSADVNSDRALWEATLQGNEHEVCRLIELGTKVNMADARGVTPLMLVGFNGHLKIAQILLEHKANVNTQAAGENNTFALKSAAENGHAKIVQLLLDEGADITMANAQGVTPLIMAAQENHVAVVKILLEYGAAANAPSIGLDTFPLLTAARKGHEKIVQLLLDEGAQADETDTKGITPLIVAAYQGHVAVVQSLLKHGANANAQAADCFTMSALAMAAQNGHLQVAQALLTTISDTDAHPMRYSCFALHRSMGRLSMKVPKDVRRLLADHFVEALVQKRMKEVVWPMIQKQDSRGQCAWLIALNHYQQEIAHLLDLVRSETTMRKLVKTNVWQVIKTKQRPANANDQDTQEITQDEAFDSFEPRKEKDEL